MAVPAGADAGVEDELDLDAPLPVSASPAPPRSGGAASRTLRPGRRRRWWTAAAVVALVGSGWAVHQTAQPAPAAHRARTDHLVDPTSLAVLGDPAQVRRLIAVDSAARQQAEADPRLVAARQQHADCSAAAQQLGAAAQEASVECAARLRTVEDVVFAQTYAAARAAAEALRPGVPAPAGPPGDPDDSGALP